MTSESSHPVLTKSCNEDGDIGARSTKILLDFMMAHLPLGTEFAQGALVGKKLGLTSYYQRYAIMRFSGVGPVSTRLLLWTVASANPLVAAMTYALLGWSRASAYAATRNTARFAGVCFLFAFAAPALVRFVRRLPSEATLVLAFVAAQGVHFATVIVLLSAFEREHVAQNPLRTALVFTLGFGLVLTAALTAHSRTARWYAALRTFALYAIFLIFTLAFAFNRLKPLRVLAVLLLAALIARLTSRVQSPTRWAAGGTGMVR